MGTTRSSKWLGGGQYHYFWRVSAVLHEFAQGPLAVAHAGTGKSSGQLIPLNSPQEELW